MANNKYQMKRTSVSGRTPNTTNSSNGSFIDVGGLAFNIPDQKVYTSNGTALIEVGSNLNVSHVQSLYAQSIYDSTNSPGSAGYVLKSDGEFIYWAASSGGGSSVNISDTAPASPTAGDFWWNSAEGQLKVYYNDGTSSQWVDASAGAMGLTGYTGSAGSLGYTGSSGAGYTGSAGSIGYTGSASTVAGPTGYTGSQGSIGYTGSAGSIGYTGSQGSIGYTGSVSNTAILTAVAAVSGDLHGIVDRTASTLSFVDGTRTFTIAPVSGSWDFYYKGTLYTVSASKSIVIANTSGARFIKIDPSTLNLVEGGSVPDFINDVIVGYIYYDTTAGKALVVGDERHTSARDTTWHSNQHLNVGTVWRSGGSVTYTLANTSNIQVGVGTPLLIADEDLLHTINNSASPAADYEQILSTAASLEVLYLSGTTYTSTSQSTTPWIAGSSLARYNQVTGGSGSLVDASEGNYITYWLLATNDIRRPVKLVLGRASHASIDAAYAEEFVEYGLSFAEQVFMYQIVLQTSSSFTNTPKVQIAGVRKVMSKVAASASTVSADIHNNLTARDALDAHPISSITGLTANLAAKQATLVSGTNIKTINGTTILGAGDISAVGYTGSAGVGYTGSQGIIGYTGSAGGGAGSSPGGANTSIQFNDSGVFGGNANFTYDKTTSLVSVNTKMHIGNTNAFDHGAMAPLEIDGNGNTYLQVVIQNANSGTMASSDLVAVADTGNDTVNYVDLGINSSTYNQAAYNIVGALDAYLYASNGHLAIGTASAKDIVFHANGTTSANEIARFKSSTDISFGNTTANAVFANGWLTIAGANAGVIVPVNETAVITAANTIMYTARSMAGRVMPAFCAPDQDATIQPSLGRNRCYYLAPPGMSTATVPAALPGTTVFTAVGTATLRAWATTNILTRTPRLGYVTATTTAGSLTSIRHPTAYLTTGTAGTPALGGFTYICRFCVSDAAAVTGARMFTGLSSTTAALTNVEYSTLTNSIGIAQLSTDATQWYLVYGGSAAQTPIALGTAIGAPTLTNTIWELVLFSPPNTTLTVGYQLKNLSNGIEVQGVLSGTSSQIPASTVALTDQMCRTNNATALAVAFDFISLYVETDQ